MIRIFYCEPCALHNRVNVVLAEDAPVEACEYRGSGPEACKRIGWTELTWLCKRCDHRTPGILHSSRPPAPGTRCLYGHTGYWVLEATSDWLVRMRPELGALIRDQEHVR